MRKRGERLSAEISKEAKDKLNEFCLKHDRSQGFLLTKMILKYCVDSPVDDDKTKAKRSKPESYPSNLDDCFEMLWVSKREIAALAQKKNIGSKTKSHTKFKSMMINSTEEICKELTDLLLADFKTKMNEQSFQGLHLITYLNQERWES